MVGGPLSSQSRVVVPGNSFGVNIQEVHQEVGPLGQASSTPLLMYSFAGTFRLRWATGKVFISFSVGGCLEQRLIIRTF